MNKNTKTTTDNFGLPVKLSRREFYGRLVCNEKGIDPNEVVPSRDSMMFKWSGVGNEMRYVARWENEADELAAWECERKRDLMYERVLSHVPADGFADPNERPA